MRITIALAALLALIGPATQAAEQCDPITGCPAVIAQTTYDGHPAYRLTDGHCEAVIVPELGRVMSYNLIGKPNLLWNNKDKHYKAGEWLNQGGSKTWPAPMDDWAKLTGRKWPPPDAWDSQPQKAEVQSGGHLVLTGAPFGKSGVKLVREFYFDANGDFVTSQIATKVGGAPLKLSLWSVAQIALPDAVLLPVAAHSDYKDGYHWMTQPNPLPELGRWSDSVLQVPPTRDCASQLGVDSDTAWALSIKDGTAFLQTSARPDGDYPDGEGGRGFPVTLFFNGQQRQPFAEVELLSPLREFRVGMSWQHTLRWRLAELPSGDLKNREMRSAIQEIIDSARKH